MFKLTLRSLLARKARIVLTAFSVMVGVAFVSGAFILTDSFEKPFDGLFKELNAGVDFRVRGAVEFGDAASGDPVPAALADTLAAIPGVAAVEPNLQGTAVILTSDGEPLKTTGGPTLGVSWTGEGGLGGTVLRQGVAPSGAGEVAIEGGGVAVAEVEDIHRAVRFLIRGSSTVAEGIQRIKDECKITKETQYLIDFAESSKRGLAK